MKRFRLPSDVFVLLDNDGDREVKIAYLESKGFEADMNHVWEEKEIESYLLLASALSNISATPVNEVKNVIQGAAGKGKELFEAVLSKLGIPGTPKGVIVSNALATSPAEIPAELMGVPKKLRRVLGLDGNGQDVEND